MRAFRAPERASGVGVEAGGYAKPAKSWWEVHRMDTTQPWVLGEPNVGEGGAVPNGVHQPGVGTST